MSREFPDLLDPWKAADGQRTFEGTMPLARMQRLVPLLAPREADAGHPLEWPDARFRARFAHDREGTVSVELWVEAELPLICQRSLRPYLETVTRHSLLAVIEDPNEQDALPDHYEPILVEQGRMALQDIVEDELLLAVPQVPRDPAVPEVEWSTVGGQAADRPEETETRRPFEDLAELMGKPRRD